MQTMVTEYLPYFLILGRKQQLPIPNWRQETTRTIDEYITSLYDRLKDVLLIARDTTLKEAQ